MVTVFAERAAPGDLWSPGTSYAAAIDEAIFKRAGWFALGAGNVRIPHLVIATVASGLEMVAAGGRVATFVGELRAEFVVVDVDIDDANRGRALTHEVAAWCRGRGLWHVIRSSGGAPGRHHVFVRHGGHEAELRDLVEQLRGRGGLVYKQLEVRRHVRPLSAPHRTGRFSRPTTDLKLALARLQEQDAGDASAPLSSKAARRRRASRTKLAEPLAPEPRQRREIPLEWRRYLATGEEPPLQGDAGPSTYGARVTAVLLQAGYGVEEAWAEIAAAHPNALTHTRSPARGRRWWITYVWNPAVLDDRAYRLEHQLQRSPAPGRVTDLVQTARRVLAAALWGWDHRSRHSIRLVGENLLDRAERTGQAIVPCPQRDLCLDTGLSRPTVAKALQALHGVLGTLHATFDPAERERSSHTFELTPVVSGVGSDLPPVLHTPVPAGCWHLLGPTAHSIWRSLAEPAQQREGLEGLARAAGLTPSQADDPTPDQMRTLRRHLTALAHAGLARCDIDGHWHQHTEIWAPDQVERAAGARAPMAEQIARERYEYRNAPGSTWRRAHADAIAGERAKAAARYEAWRAGLSAEERRERARRYAERFHGLTTAAQARLKDVMAQRRRRRAGPTEAERHDAWCRSMSRLEYADRCAERTLAFEQLDGAEKAARVAAWTDHRDRWRIPLGHPDLADTTDPWLTEPAA